MKTMKKIVAILAVALMLCSILPLSVFAADTYELASSIAAGDTVVLVCTSAKKELTGISTTSTKYGIGTAYSSTPAATYVLTVEDGYTSGTYSFKCSNGQYLYWSSGNSLATNATKNANTSWKVTFSGTNVTIVNAKDNSRKLQWNNSSPRFACYTSSQTAIQLFKKVVAEPEAPSTCEHTNAQYEHDCLPTVCPDCEETLPARADHSYNENVTLAPTCTEAGEKTLTCACGDVKTEAVKALGHTWVDGACDVCGEVKPLEATIDFSTKDQRTEFTTDKQVWENDGLTLVNDKAGSTNPIGDYANPARFYKSSTITITYAGMTSLVIDASNGGSNADWKATLSNYSYTVENNVYTITFADPTDSITLTCAAQVRAKSITAYGSAASNCEHNYVGEETQAPTCSVPGVTTYTCSECGDVYTEEIATIPHNYVADIIDSTCTATGSASYECSVCFDSYDEVIPVKAHNYVDDVCSACGAVKAYKGTITFDADKTQRVEYSTQIQVWKNEGLTLTNNKASSTTNVGDYSGRFYKSSQIIIEFPEMGKLIIDANDINGDYQWTATLNAAGLTYTEADGVYTITFDEAVNSIELTASNQLRANSITAIVAHECVYDNACDADCNKCGTTREVGEHTYAGAFDTTCDNCGAERAVVAPVTANGFSVSEDVSGLAVKFEIPVIGMGINKTTAIYDNATLNGYKLISMGAIASNGASEKDIPAVYLCDDDVSTSAQFAIRVKNIPADKYDVAITFTPYVIVEIDGEQVTIYGEAQTRSYNG